MFNTAYANIFAISFSLNIIIFHYSYARPDDVNVTFVGNRYVYNWRSILMIQSGPSEFEPITNGGMSVWKARNDELAGLYRAFCPNEYQFYTRLGQLSEYCYPDTLTQILIETPAGIKIIGLELPNGVIVPTIQSNPIVNMMKHKMVLTSQCWTQPILLVNTLRQLSTFSDECAAFEPRRGLLGIDGLIHALVLADKRLICHFETPIDIMLMDVPTEPNTSFIGIKTLINYQKCDIGIALGPNTGEITSVFKHLLECVYVRTKTFYWNGLKYMDCRTRRRQIQDVFVEPVIHGNIPIAPHIMCAMLVAFCEQHPDPETWLSSLDWNNNNNEDAITEAGLAQQQQPSVLKFSSPKEYLSWVARRTE